MKLSFLTPIVLLFIVVIGSCHQTPQTSINDTLSIAAKVKGCAASAATKSVETIFDDITPANSNPFTISGDTLMYRRTMKHLCCRKVTVEGTLQGNTIVVEEKWFGMGCKCECKSTVEAVITNLKQGQYNVLVMEGGTDPLTDKPQSARDTIWKGSIEIK